MKSLGQQLPQTRGGSATELTRLWTNDYNQRLRSQPSTTGAASAMSNQWLKQYQPQSSLSQSSTGSTMSTTQRELEGIWNQSRRNASVFCPSIWKVESLIPQILVKQPCGPGII